MLLLVLAAQPQLGHTGRRPVYPAATDSSLSLAGQLAEATAGDTLVLHPGTYRGTYTLKRGVSILGLAGADSTILDAAGERYCLKGIGLDSTSVISGLTMQNGRRPHANSGGGGIYLHRSSPIVTHNVFRNHLGYLGPGVYMNYFCRAIVAFNVFYDNEGYLGGAVAAYQDCAPLVYNNVFYNNKAISGGGVLCMNSVVTILNNTMVHNEVSQGGGGVYFDSSPSLVEANIIAHSRGGAGFYCLDADHPATVRDNVLWANEDPEALGECSSFTGVDGNVLKDPGLGEWNKEDPTGLAREEGAGARRWVAGQTVPEDVLQRWRSWRSEHMGYGQE